MKFKLFLYNFFQMYVQDGSAWVEEGSGHVLAVFPNAAW